MNYIIRELNPTEYPLLDDFLYEAIFIPEGVDALPKSIISSPELQVYVADFGTQKHDRALLAETDGKIVGAVWVRIMNDYGHIDDRTPSLAISLYKEYRGLGIGTALMKEMLSILKNAGYKQTSLSVQKANYAFNMYRKLGYEIAMEHEEEYIMVKHLSSTKSMEAMSQTTRWYKEENTMKKITLFHLSDCPYCHNAKRALEELKKENPAYGEIEIDWIEEREQPELAEKYDYYYVPTMYVGDKKMYEAKPSESYAECKENVKAVLDAVL